MKKIFTLLVLSLLLVSCFGENTPLEPIEKYRGKGIIIVNEPNGHGYYESLVMVKNKDSVFWIRIPRFDANNLKPGDAIK